MDLLDHDHTRFMGLQVLLTFTHVGGRTQDAVLREIAQHGKTLSRVIRDESSNRKVKEAALMIMAHSVQYHVCSIPSTPDSGFEDLDWREMLQTALDTLRTPQPSCPLLTHALMLLVTPVHHVPARCMDETSLILVLVALLRTKGLATRASAMEAMLVLCQVGSGPDTYGVDLVRLADSLERPRPPPVALTFVTWEDYPQWLHQSESLHLYRSSSDYIEAMSQAVRDRDLCSLGRSVANLAQHSFSAVEGRWEELQRRIGQRSYPNLPFNLWSDALPECASQLRLTGIASDLDAADILDMKYFTMHDMKAEAVVLAKKTIERNPKNTYAYYVISVSGDMADGLEAALQGLRCPALNPFLRKQLLCRAEELGMWQGIQHILTADVGDQESYDQGAMLLDAAYKHTETFLIEASQDAHLRVTMLGWNILLAFVLHGSELSDDLKEIQVSTIIILTALSHYTSHL